MTPKNFEENRNSFHLDLKIRKTTARCDFCGTKKNSVCRFDFFFYDRNDSATGFPDTPLSFSGKRQLFLKFSKIWKKSILKRFSCIFPYREVIGKIH